MPHAVPSVLLFFNFSLCVCVCAVFMSLLVYEGQRTALWSQLLLIVYVGSGDQAQYQVRAQKSFTD